MKPKALRSILALVFVFGVVLAVTPVALAADTWTVNAALGDDSGCVSPTFQCKTIGAAVSAAAAGDTINVLAGTYTLTSNVTINQANLSLIGAGAGSTFIKVSGTGDRLTLSASGVTVQGFDIEKTDKTGEQNIIRIANGNNATIKNNTIHGQFVIGDGEVSRALIVNAGAFSGMSIEGNTIYALRQPAYISGTHTGTIQNNTVYGTKGWVLEGGNLTFTGNTWGTGANVNVYDVAILSAMPAAYYMDIVAMSNANNGAVIEDQRVSPAVLSVVYVDAATSYTTDLGGRYHPYSTISPAITRVVAGGKINVAAGTYAGNITINKSVTLLGDPGDANPGPGANAPVVDGGSAPGDAFLIANGVSNVTIQGFEIRNFTSNDTGIGNGVSAWVGSTSNITIQDNYFHNLGYNGVLVGNDKSSDPSKWGDHTHWTIKGNILETFEAYGFELTNASNSSIENNIIHSNATWNLASTCIMVDARRSESGIVIKGNQIDGEMWPGYPAVYVFANSFETPNVNLNDVLIEANIISTTSSTATAQVIVYNYAGTGTVTGVQVHGNSLSSFKTNTPALVNAEHNYWGTVVFSEIAPKISGSVDWSPWCNSTFTACTYTWPVHNTTQGIDYQTIQAAVDAANSGDAIQADAGTYREHVVLNKAVTITGDRGDVNVAGPGPNAPILDGDLDNNGTPDKGDGFTIPKNTSLSGITIEGFIVRNFGNGGGGNGVGCGIISWENTSSNVTIRDNQFTNLGYNGVYVGTDSDDMQTNWLVQYNIVGGAPYAGIELTDVTDSQVLDNEITAPTVIFDDPGDAGVGIEIAARARTGLVATTNVQIKRNTITGAFASGSRAGINILSRAYDSGSTEARLSGITVEGNVVSGSGTRGIDVVAESRNSKPSRIENLTITQNILTGNTAGIEVGGAFTAPKANGTYDAATISVGNNKLEGNAVFGLSNLTVVTINASGNWWGTNVAATVKTAANGGALVDYTPWLNSSTDTAPGTAGFQGDFSTLWVDDDSPQTGTTGRIQEGINLVSGSTVNVAAGLYAERISIPKALTLLGATAGVSKKNYVAPTGYAYDPNVESIIKPATDALVPVIDVEKVGGGDIAGSITIKGFVLTDQGATNNDALRGLINLNIYTGLPDGILIENNVIGPHTGPTQNGLKGRGGISSEGPSNRSRKNMVIRDNLIFDNLGDGVGVMLVGAYLSQGSTQDYSGARIENNTISGNTRSGIEIAGGVNGSVADPFVIANNTIKDSGWKIGYGLADYATKLKYGNGINFIRGGGETDSQNNGDPVARIPLYPFSSPTYVSITGNEITHNEKNGIYMGPMPQHITVAGNKIQSNGTGGGSYQTWDGIRIDLEENYYGVPGVRPYTLPLVLNKFTNNVFNNNAITGNGDMGMRVVQTPTSPVDATSNWWGSACGPGPVGPGSGDKVSTNVLYSPWWTDASGGGTASEGSGGGLVIPAGASTATQNAVIACAGGKTVTYAGNPLAGGVVVNTNGVTINLNGATIGPGSPAFTINADDVTLLGPGALDGNGSLDPGVLVNAGADNFMLQDVEVREWADGVQVAGAVTSLKIVGNWLHSNTDAGLQVDGAVGGIASIEGNLFKVNGGDGVKYTAAGTLKAEYNSWGDLGGPNAGVGDGANAASVDFEPWTFAEVFLDMNPEAEAISRSVPETTSFDVKLKADAATLYGLTFKFTYDTAKLTLNTTTFAAPWAGRCTAMPLLPTGTVGYFCNLLTPDAEWTADGGTVATFNFTALTMPGGNGPWAALFDIAHAAIDTSAAAKNGARVYMNNAGFNAPSATARDITDGNDGVISIDGLANYTGYVDLQGRANDAGATLKVYDVALKSAAVQLAGATSASSGGYTTAHLTGKYLTINTTYYFQIDRALYLPTTAMATTPSYPTIPTGWQHSKQLTTRPLTSLGTVVLLGGDATNNDAIDINDATCIGGDYGKTSGLSTCGGAGSSDVNGDSAVNVLDLSLMGGNFYLTASPWTP